MALLIRRAFRHLSRVHDVLFRRTLLEREITFFDDDTFLTSYPRSGNTWTRFLLGNLVHPDEPITFLNVERLVPDMYKSADWVLRRLPRPRVLKSHECFDARYRRVIYIVRDPRDVAISNYHWETKLRSFPEDRPIEEFVPRWMDGNYWRRVGSWADHVNSWLATRQDHPGFMLVRYEDMQESPQRELARASIAPSNGVQRPTCEKWKKRRARSGSLRSIRDPISPSFARRLPADGGPCFLKRPLDTWKTIGGQS